MEKPLQSLEALTVRRATIADNDKVRYRVYTTPTEFVAVIAESALMAVRASGIKTPYKIMRDLASENGVIAPKKLDAKTEMSEQVMVTLEAKERIAQYITDLGNGEEGEPILFVPMAIADLQNKGMTRARILPAELLHEIIEEHTKNAVAVEQPLETSVKPPEELVREPELSPAERLSKLADETLPPPQEAAPAQTPETPAAALVEEGLSPEEVEKLLNG